MAIGRSRDRKVGDQVKTLLAMLVAVLIGIGLTSMLSSCGDINKRTPGVISIKYTFAAPDGTPLRMIVNREQPVNVYTHNGVTYTYKLDGTLSAVPMR